MTLTKRLSDDARRCITNNLVGKRFDARKKECERLRTDLAHAVYDRAFSILDQNKMLVLPNGWLPMVRKVKARFAGEDTQLDMCEEKPVPHEKFYCQRESHFLVNLPDHDSLTSRFLAIRSEERLIASQESKIRDEIRGVLYSATTTAKLIKIWPEIKSVVESVCRVSDVSNLPVPQVSELNLALGLRSPTVCT